MRCARREPSLKNNNFMNKCLLCKKPARWKESSPDGEPDYFCTKRHFLINRDYFHAKGIVWRALPLEKINNK